MRLLYQAVTREGKKVRGVINANDTNEATAYLRSKNFIPISISKESKSKFLDALPMFSQKITASDLVIFTRQLSSMLTAGLTLIKSLEILKEQLEKEAMIEIVDNIITDIEEGSTFSSAIAKYPQVFSSIYVSLIKASETSGLLDRSLLRLADNLEKQQKLKGTIRSALMYPIIVIILMVVVVAIMMVFVIPQLSVLYNDLNIPLPLPTQIIVSLSNFVIIFWPVILAAIVLSVFFYKRWHKTENGQLIIDNLLLKLPVFGVLIRKTILVEFSRTLGLMIGTGSLVVESLIKTSDISGNIHYKNAILDVARRVEKGVTVGDAMAAYTLFPPVLVQLVKIGEQTGKLDETLIRASEYFEGEVNETVKALTTALEPFIMVVLGIGVAFLIISVITPIYSLTSSIQ
ncbi:MAG: type II secretion system F family protein [Candidatus Levybacteria bacterium]|nr:type II secretion system F family protein [Candidatus Levybacteria bacterium]